MGEVKAVPNPVLSVEACFCLGLCQNHVAPIEPFDGPMTVSDPVGYLLQRHTELLVNISHVFGLTEGVPRLHPVYVPKAQVSPEAFPVGIYNHRQCIERATPLIVYDGQASCLY